MANNFFAYYPPTGGGGSSSNASVGANGVTAPTSSTEIGFINGSGLQTPVSPSNPLPATISNFPTEQNINLNEVGGTAFTLGQALAASSLPVVLTAAQLSTLTPLSSISVNNFPPTQPVSGTVTANQGTSPWVTSVSNFPATQPVSGTVAVSNFPATQPVSGTVSISGTVPVSGTFFQATQPISAASLPLPTGAATSALQTTINTTLGSPMQQTGGSVTVLATDGSFIDRSGTITSANTSQQVAASNSSRKYFTIQNLSSSAFMYINFGSAATEGSGSLVLLPYASWTMESFAISTQAINIISSTASAPYTAKEL